MTTIAITEIVSLSTRVLLKAGLTSAEVEVVIGHLLDGELSGHPSHGFLRIPKIVKDLRTHSVTDMLIERETESSILINGGYKTGLIVAEKAVDLALAKASNSGSVTIGGYNNTGTIGSLGYFTKKIAERGYIGIMMVASEYAMAPWGGRDAVLGTNPISFAFPTMDWPIVVDFASSVWSYGALKIAMKEGRSIPLGIVLDEFGADSTDPNDADNGSQLPIAHHKGYALALAIEILAGLFVNAKAGSTAVKGTDGFLMIALPTSLFIPTERYYQNIAALIEEIKSSRLRPGFEEVFLPGQKSHNQRVKMANALEISIPDEILAEIYLL